MLAAVAIAGSDGMGTSAKVAASGLEPGASSATRDACFSFLDLKIFFKKRLISLNSAIHHSLEIQ